MNEFPIIMGIANITPDSFSDGGKITDAKFGVEYCLKMYDDGAEIIDIGGESTRPGSDFVSTEVEINRVIPIISELKKIEPKMKISIDTTKYEVAQAALDLGCDFINDISGLRFEPRLADLANEYNVPIILMHSRKNPKIMQLEPHYDDFWSELLSELQHSVNIAKEKKAPKIIVDPGIGFAKTYDNNIDVLKHFDRLYELNLPILLGLSRKSFIGKMTGENVASERDIATLILHTLLLKYKIEYIRVHNVEYINLLKMVYQELH